LRYLLNLNLVARSAARGVRQGKKRMTSRFASIIIILAALLPLGCASKRYDAFQHQNDLRLTIAVEQTTIRAKGQLDVLFTFANEGKEPLRVLVRTGRSGCTFRGTKELIGLLNVVDHPSPNRIEWLQPHATIKWRESFALPPVGLGPVEIGAAVPIYKPGSCTPYGCDESSIRSNQLSLEITE